MSNESTNAPDVRREILPGAIYNVSETADLLRVSRATVCALVASGDIRSLKLGARRLLRGDQVLEYLARCEVAR